MPIPADLLIKSNTRAYSIPVYGENKIHLEHVYKENNIFKYTLSNKVVYYDKHTDSKPKHHTLGIVKGNKLKFCKFTKGFQYDNPMNVFSQEKELIDLVGEPIDIAPEVNLWFTDDAYWHYLYEDLPVLKHCMENDFPIVTSPLNNWQKELLNYFGDIKKRIVEVPLPCVITAENFFIYTESNAGGGRNSEWANVFIRDHLKPSDFFIPTRKIYISRKDADARKVTNEKEVIEYLKKKDFEIVYDMPTKTIQEKIDMFAQAKIVISVSGSTLCHVHAMKPGTTCIDTNHLITLDPNLPIQEFAFNNVGNTVGVNYISFVSKTKHHTDTDRTQRTMDRDLEIDLSLLEKILEQV